LTRRETVQQENHSLFHSIRKIQKGNCCKLKQVEQREEGFGVEKSCEGVGKKTKPLIIEGNVDVFAWWEGRVFW